MSEHDSSAKRPRLRCYATDCDKKTRHKCGKFSTSDLPVPLCPPKTEESCFACCLGRSNVHNDNGKNGQQLSTSQVRKRKIQRRSNTSKACSREKIISHPIHDRNRTSRNRNIGEHIRKEQRIEVHDEESQICRKTMPR